MEERRGEGEEGVMEEKEERDICSENEKKSE